MATLLLSITGLFAHVVSAGSPFSLLDGSGCQVEGNCLLSSRRRRYNGGDEGCRALVAPTIGPLEIIEFHTQHDWDRLEVNNVDYSGTKGPENVVPKNTITWSPSVDGGGEGWTICSSTTVQTTTPSPFTLVTGTGCEVQGKCLTSSRRRRYEFCPMIGLGIPCLPEHCVAVVAPNAGPLNVSEFHTETGSDILELNGVLYSGTQGPPNGIHPQAFVVWTQDGWYSEAGWTICAEPDALPDEDPDLPFVLLNGTACSVQGHCISSARRRRHVTYDPPEECNVQVKPGTGPLSIVAFDIGDDQAKFTLNGKHYTHKGSPPDQGIRPEGIITWSTHKDEYGQTFRAEGWTICAVPRFKTGETVESPDDNHSLSSDDISNASSLIRGAINGAGETFDFLSSADNRTIARLACESHYGTNGCLEGSCACFKYYYRKGALSCHPNKAPWEYEWVFENRGDSCNCNYAGGDYRTLNGFDYSDCLRYGMLPHLFVRQLRYPDDREDPWHLVLRGFGDKLPSHHLVLDLRAAQFTPGSAVWPSLVGEAALVNGHAFDSNKSAFVFGAHAGTDAAVMNVSIGTMTSSTWSVWVRSENLHRSVAVVTSARSLESDKLPVWRSLFVDQEANNEWFHVVLTHANDTDLSIYLNGVGRQLTAPGHSFSVYDSLLIGGDVQNSSSESIWISDVAIFNRSLHDWEVAELFSAGRPSGSVLFDGLSRCIYNGHTDYYNYRHLVYVMEKSNVLEPEQHYRHSHYHAASLYLNCLKDNEEDADVHVLQALYATTSSCSTLVNTMDCQADSNLSTSATIPLAWLCPRSCAVTGSLWKVTSGNCTINGRCVKSPFYPLSAAQDQACNVQGPASPLSSPLPHQRVLDGFTPYQDSLINPTYWTSGNQPTQGWIACYEEPSCGANCANHSSVSCHPKVEGCGTSILQGFGSCMNWRGRPHAVVESCEETAWVQLDLGKSLEIDQVLLQSCPGERHCGRRVELSEDAGIWQTVFQQGPGYGEAEPEQGTVLSFAAQTARFVRVTSSRALSQPLALFQHVAVSSTPCVDDESWTDRKYGDGQMTCMTLARNQDWCIQRGHYSVHAQKACPGACGTCGRSMFRRISELDKCVAAMQIDNATNDEHSVSALSCYWHCLSSEKCTHFQWDASATCKRFEECDGRYSLCEGSEPLGQCRPSGLSGENYAIIPEKVATSHNAFEEKSNFLAVLVIRTTKSCAKDLKDDQTCFEAGGILGLPVTSQEDSRTGKGTCMFNTDTGVLGMQVRITTGVELLVCSRRIICICDERVPGGVPLIRHGPADEQMLIRHGDPSSGVIDQGSSDTSPYTYDYDSSYDSDSLFNDVSGLVSNFCNISNASRCVGKNMKLRRIGPMPGRFGPIIPFPTDWDGDGDLDLLLGRHSGELVYLQNVHGILDFADVVGLPKATPYDPCLKNWEGPDVGSCGHWCCFDPSFGDVCYGYGTSTWAACARATAWNVTVAAGALIPVPVDLDGDSDVDLITASCDGTMQYWRRDETGETILTPTFGDDNPFAGIQLGAGTCFYPDVVDWDGDGDFDLILGRESGKIDFYENRSGRFMHVTGESSPFHNVAVAGLAAPCAVDFDGDGDVDLLVGNLEGTIEFFARSEVGSLVYVGPLDNIKVGASIPRALDWDADGSLDLIVTDRKSGAWYLWKSEFDGDLTEQTLTSPFAGLSFGRVAMPQVLDWQGNGHWDLFVSELDGTLHHYEADEDGVLVPVPLNESALNGLTPTPGRGAALHVVDWDNDGDLDLLAGQEGGQILLYERDNETDRLAPGQQLMLGLGLGDYPVPHAVDWDGDGDVDLFVADSGVVFHPRSLRLAGFPREEWNVEYLEQGPEISIGRKGILQSPDGQWIVAYCELGYWFLFENSGLLLEINRGGQCSGAVAKHDGDDVLDTAHAGRPGRWQVHSSSFAPSYASYRTVAKKIVTADGSDGKPFCDTCNNQQTPECNCSLSKNMEVQCAAELCEKQGLTLIRPVSATSNPLNMCSCVDTDDGAKDLHGATCGPYKTHWCGQYDSAKFSAKSMCCVCGGGRRPSIGSTSFTWAVTAECYDPQVWVPWVEATSMPDSPFVGQHGAVRYFERVTNSATARSYLVEQVGSHSPLDGLGLSELSYRPFPFVVDWNGDGLLDLIVGSDNPWVQTYAALRTGCRALASCDLSNENAADCAAAACQRKGLATGGFLPSYESLVIRNGKCSLGEPWPGGEVWNPDLDKWEYVGAKSAGEQSNIMAGVAKCFAHASLRYFQSRELRPALEARPGGTHIHIAEKRGRLVEQKGTDDPFHAVESDRSAVVFIVDYDFDGQKDVVLGTDSGTLRYFSIGKQCEQGDLCNNKGICDKSKGTCSCIHGYGLDDCSGCARHYYSRRTPSAEASHCLPCPERNGSVCAGRGVCLDDETAKQNFMGSSAAKIVATGTGHCTCNDPFHGTNELGLVSCTEGACGPGKEPRRKDADTATETCELCRAGTSKNGTSNDKCEVCPERHYSQAGAEVCSACPRGRYQDKPEQESCHLCPRGTTSETGSIACSPCAVGRYADKEDMGECPRCPAGKWSSVVGASQCSDCDLGRFSDGLSECQACDSGSYADRKGSGNCTACEPGSYSSVHEAKTSTVCQLCETGRYSRSRGARTPGNCTACGEGATTAGKGASHESMCIQPYRADHTCISGEPCEITTYGSNLQSDRHVMAITSMTSPRSLILMGLTSTDGTTYKWAKRLDLSGGTYDLFWCAGIHDACSTLDDFNFHVGQLEVTGPIAANFTCVRGRPCQGLGPISGTGLTSTDTLLVRDSCGLGQGPVRPMAHGSPQSGRGLAEQVSINEAGDMWLDITLSSFVLTASPRMYQICWCGKKVESGYAGRYDDESEAPESACMIANLEDFHVAAASLEVQGPWEGQKKACNVGQKCYLRGIQGRRLLAGDRLMVQDFSQNPLAGMLGGAIAETTDGLNFNFLAGGPEVMRSIPGLYNLWFCRPLPGMGCEVAEDFWAAAGYFTAKGPFSHQVYVCYIASSTCDLDMSGHGLEDGGELEVQRTDEADACALAGVRRSEEHPAGFEAVQAAAHVGGKRFSLGAIPTDAQPGQYRICWRPQGFVSFGANAGVLFVTCPSGTYRVQSDRAIYCAGCPLGFFCEGGTSLGGFRDDGKTTCKEGSTTHSRNSTSKDQCLCRPGFHLDDSRSCVACPQGRYKTAVGDDTHCPGICGNGTTSQSGARSPDQCFSGSAGKANKTEAEVFIVELAFQIPACLDDSEMQDVTAQIKKALASSLRVLPTEVTFNMEGLKKCHSQNAAARRLQDESQQLTFRITQASKAEAQSLTEKMTMEELEADMKEKVNVGVTAAVQPNILSEVLSCSLRGPGMTFPPGSTPTSLDDCKCAPGHGDERDTCQTCALGRYKATVGQVQCRRCGTAPTTANVNQTSAVWLTTLVTGATGEQLCTCPAGYIVPANSTEQPPKSCEPCKVGNYCPGGSASLPCPSGTSTLAEGSTSLEQCLCEAGFKPFFGRNDTHRCVPCEAGQFKSTLGDEPCSEECRANSNSFPGAKTGADCFCNNGTYFLSTPTNGPTPESLCLPCPDDGVECPGGFEPPDSRKHAVPRSLAGYYLTGFAEAQECYIFDEDGESLCLAAATAQNDSGACGGQQTGIMCGACLHLSARDVGDEPCEECGEELSDWMHVASMNLDLCLKAAFGIFLGKQAMDSATKSKRMEAVMLRILLQWVTASSVLGTFDLSAVRIFDWSVEELLKQASSGAAFITVAEASGISLNFQFPEWFRSVWRTITAVTGSIPSPLSPQISLECLMQRQQTQPPAVPPRWQLLIPAIWWLLYPFFVTVWVAVICILIAKVVYPLTLWFTARVKKYLWRRMRGAGVSAKTAEATLEAMDPAQMSEVMKDHTAMRSDAGLVKALGGDVFAEAAASFLVAKASAECLAILRELLEGEAKEEIKKVAKEVLEGEGELLSPFLTDVIKQMDPESLKELFSKPQTIPPVLQSFLEEETTAVNFKLVRMVSSISRESSFKPTIDARGMIADQADGDLFGDEAIPGKDLNEGYIVFGLFQGTSVSTVLKDAFPLYAVTLYSLWDVVTRRMLGLVQVKTILITLGARSTEPRWLYDMRFTVFKGDHILIGLVGLLGLVLWSITFLVLLFRKLRGGKYMLQEKGMMRNFGYFYSGLEPNAYWWEVLVKKSDIFVLYVVTFTEIFPDPKAKLVMYLGLAGIFWAAHNMYHPYDDRQNHLADRIEDLGLGTRFVTILVIQLLLMLNARPEVNAVMAILLIVINLRFLFIMGFILAIENTGTEDAASSARDKITEKVVERFGFGGHKHPLASACMGVMNRVFKYTIRPIVGLVFKVFSLMAKLKDTASRKVPHLQWQGVGSDFIMITHEHEKLPWHVRVFSFFVNRLYKLDDREQKAFIAHTIGKFWDYVLNNSDCHQLPPNIMDVFFLLPSAVKKERAEPPMEASAPFHVRVAKRVRSTLVQSCDFRPGTLSPKSCLSPTLSPRALSPLSPRDTTRSSRRSAAERKSTRSSLPGRVSSRSSAERISLRTPFKYSAGLPEHTHSGEDFNSALLFIQRLSKIEVHEFLIEALAEEEPCSPTDSVLPEGGARVSV